MKDEQDYDEKLKELRKYSDPYIVYTNAKQYYGDDVEMSVSTRKNKKYMMLNPYTNKWVHFGEMGFSDYTLHKDKVRRMNYRLRASNILGDWEQNKYSPNYLSLQLLWG